MQGGYSRAGLRCADIHLGTPKFSPLHLSCFAEAASAYPGPIVQGFVLGNPPFVGHQWRNTEQQADIVNVWGEKGRFGRLDYVTCWYLRAADYIRNTVPIGVHVVIIGFSSVGKSPKRIYDYDASSKHGDATTVECLNISPFLVAGSNLILPSRTNPPAGLPQMNKGSQPTDGGHLILTNGEKEMLVAQEPASSKWLRRFVGGQELINGDRSWCLWLKGAAPAELRKLHRVMERVAKVRQSRLKSPTPSVRAFASRPTLFTQDRQPDVPYLAVPEVSSENRRYIPIAFLEPTVVASNKLQIIVGATRFHFGVLTSAMHMSWVRQVAGRLKSDYSYSPSVNNNYPWPECPSQKHRAAVETAAKRVIEVREKYVADKNATLADLYDALITPDRFEIAPMTAFGKPLASKPNNADSASQKPSSVIQPNPVAPEQSQN